MELVIGDRKDARHLEMTTLQLGTVVKKVLKEQLRQHLSRLRLL